MLALPERNPGNNHCVDLRLILQISPEQTAGAWPHTAKLIGERLRTLGGAVVVQRDIKPEAVQMAGNRTTDTFGTTGNQCNLCHASPFDH